MIDTVRGVYNYTKISETSEAKPSIDPNQAFLAMMALGKKGKDKITTMERMALLSMIAQKKEKNEISSITMLPTGFGSAAFTFGGTGSSYTSKATPVDNSCFTGAAVDIEA